jgi:phytoene desaturase
MKAIIIGGGIGGLATAAMLAKSGYEVDLVEKNEQLGGRAGVRQINGFTFDMGPSWYLMPEVFEHWFDLMGEKVSDHLELVRLDPSYRVKFEGRSQSIDIKSNYDLDAKTVEELEPGSAVKLRSYLAVSKEKYDIATQRFLYKNYSSVFDFLSLDMITKGPRLSVFSSMNNYVSRRFKTIEMQQLLQYTLVFLGSSPYNTPALYSLMNHVDFVQGVFYPVGGFGSLIRAMASIGTKAGVNFRTNSPVVHIMTKNGRATGVKLESGEELAADIVISNTDPYHTETKLLSPEVRSYSPAYWKKRVLAPSALLIYLGVRGKVPELSHHNLRFSTDWKRNFKEIFDEPVWPDNPSIYISAPSVTDPGVAPVDHENLMILVPISAKLKYTQEQLEVYATKMIELLQNEFKIPDLAQRITTRELFSVKDFESRYNAQSGTALGLSHTLFQTAIFRTSNISKKLSNLYYVGASTSPGIGMPICLISAELVYKRLIGDKTAAPLVELYPLPKTH